MNYTEERFQVLTTLVIQDGGMLLPDPCDPEPLEFKEPEFERGIPQRSKTCGCGHMTRFAIPYDAGEDHKAAAVTACAVCDDVGAWPGYEECQE